MLLGAILSRRILRKQDAIFCFIKRNVKANKSWLSASLNKIPDFGLVVARATEFTADIRM